MFVYNEGKGEILRFIVYQVHKLPTSPSLRITVGVGESPMGNSEADNKPPATARSIISTRLFFIFVSFSLLLLFLLSTTRNPALFLPLSLYRDHFSFRTSSPAESAASAPQFQPQAPPTTDQPNKTDSVNIQIPNAPISELIVDGVTPPDISKGSDSILIGESPPISQESEKKGGVGSPNLVPQDPELSGNAGGPSVSQNQVDVKDVEMIGINGGSSGLKKCNLYMGKWVRDESGGYPLYEPGSCPYVDEGFVCQGNGRPDSEYLRWRWKPDGCELPRFNPADFLERLRGKRLTLVGDSMNRNQFESILCLLREGLADKRKMFEIHGYKITKGRGYFVFKFVDYNCTVEFIRSHFLVREGVRKNAQGNSNPTLSIDRIDKSSRKWKRTDILVFNTGHWWTHGKIARGKNYFKEGDQVYPQFDAVEAYRRSMKTWGEWIDRNVNPEKQLVFYRAYSSAHFRGGDWDSGGTCNGETEPIPSGAYLDSYPLKMKIVEEVIYQMRVPVVLLNITRLTNFRKDGHPSIYGKNATAGVRVSRRRQDCSHWCLPGVPDAWNELIYATLVYHQTPASWSL